MNIIPASLLSVLLLAASLSPAAAQSQTTWRGLYGGVFLGDAWTPSDSTASSLPSSLADVALPSGPTVGSQLGFNLQSGFLVYGLEGEMSLPDLEDLPWCSGGGDNCSDSPHQFEGSLRARGGVVFDRVLFYGTAGYAFSNLPRHPDLAFDHSTVFRDGWTAGAGIEFALSDSIRTSVEYRRTFYNNDSGGGLPDPESNTVMLRLNFH